jgi:heat shock protein HslJ
MNASAAASAAILAIVLAACRATEPASPLPGTVDAPPPPMTPVDVPLTQTVWSWRETLTNDGRSIAPEAPERYTVEFSPGGALAVRADCNRGSGSYVLDGSALRIGPIATTRAMCPPGSADAEFLAELARVSRQEFRGRELVLALGDGSGSMRFAGSSR